MSAAAALSVAGRVRWTSSTPRVLRSSAMRATAARSAGPAAGASTIVSVASRRAIRRAACSALSAAMTLTPSGSSREASPTPPSLARRATTTHVGVGLGVRGGETLGGRGLAGAAGADEGDRPRLAAEVGHDRHAARQRGADQLLDVARVGERQAVGHRFGDDVLGERGAQAGGDEPLLVRVGYVRALGAEALAGTASGARGRAPRARPAGSSHQVKAKPPPVAKRARRAHRRGAASSIAARFGCGP